MPVPTTIVGLPIIRMEIWAGLFLISRRRVIWGRMRMGARICRGLYKIDNPKKRLRAAEPWLIAADDFQVLDVKIKYKQKERRL